MYIAVEGCCHGALDEIYNTMQQLEKRDNIKIDLLLCCGDFQAVRDEADLSCMAVPDKYKSMESFWEYYKGTKKAPYLTVFIGGNHEASNHLQELPYGGWVAPNIYYMGYANVITYKGVRIGGISGIFKYHDYTKGHYEKPPYDQGSKRSVYHVRSSEVFKLKLLKNPVDIMMSHDWPNGIVHYGNVPYLLRKKPFFEKDIQTNRLGSPPLMELVQHMRPKRWFSGHLHVKFMATVPHCDQPNSPPTSFTEFLALDKCLPRREFLQVVPIEPKPGCENQGLCYDPEWLAVLRATNDLLSVSRKFVWLPPLTDTRAMMRYEITKEKVNDMVKLFNHNMTIPNNFKQDTACVYDSKAHNRYKPVQLRLNPHTADFCHKLMITDPLVKAVEAEGGDLSLSFNSSSFFEEDDIPSTIVSCTSVNEDEIPLDTDSEDEKKGDDENGEKIATSTASSVSSEEDSGSKISSGSESSTNIKRLSLSLPPPTLGVTSTPIRSVNDSSVKFSTPIADDCTPIKPFPEPKDSPVLSTSKKRPSDTESDPTDSGSENSSVAKKFKRRNASFYSSQNEDDASQ